MSDVTIPFFGDVSAQAVTLLASAEALDLDQSVVRTSTRGFVVPEEVAKTARKEGLDEREPVEDPKEPTPASAGTEGGDRKAPPAKKTAPAKKAAAKKAPATKTTTTKE